METIYLFNGGHAAIIEDTETGERYHVTMLTSDDAPLGDEETETSEE